MIPSPYAFLIKLGLFAAAVIGLYAAGYYRGREAVIQKHKAEIVTHILLQTKYLPQETKIIHDKQVVIQTVHDKVYIDVIKTVPDNRACDVPAAGVGLLNANRGALPASK